MVVTARDARSGASLSERMLATCRALRSWATTHPAEFGWIFASPVAERNRGSDSTRYQAGQRFEEVFLELIVELWETRPFPVPDLADLPESLRDQLRAYSATLENRLPPEAVHVFLSCWIRLYGLLCMEVLHQLDFAFADPEPLAQSFEPGRRFPEREIDVVLRAWCAGGGTDHVTVRRYLVDEGFLGREHGMYWRTGGWVDVSTR